MIRAKFRVVSIDSVPNGEGNYVVRLTPVQSYDPSSEDGQFQGIMPTGRIELGYVTALAAEYFDQGKEYYLDFTKAE